MLKIVLIVFLVIAIILGILAFLVYGYMRSHPNGSFSFSSHPGPITVKIGPYSNWNQQACYLSSGCKNYVINYCRIHGGTISGYTLVFGKGTIPCKFSNGKTCDASDFYQGLCSPSGLITPTP